MIPGLGYLYSGHKGTALTSLLVNGLLMYACYTSIQNENYGLAVLTGVISLSFYIGNISGSAKARCRAQGAPAIRSVKHADGARRQQDSFLVSVRDHLMF